MVHLPAPKTFCKRDLELTEDTPFFATADAPLVLIRKGTIDGTNTEMMNVRWRYFHFWKKIPQAEQKHFAPCGHCFARFILSYRDFTNQSATQFENTETEKGPGRERRHERGKNKVTDANATTEAGLCKSFKLR